MPNNQKKAVKKVKVDNEVVSSTSKDLTPSKVISSQKNTSKRNSSTKKKVVNPVEKEKKTIKNSSDDIETVIKKPTTNKSKNISKTVKKGTKNQEKDKEISSTKTGKKTTKKPTTNSKSTLKTVKKDTKSQKKDRKISATKVEEKIAKEPTTKSKSTPKTVRKDTKDQKKDKEISATKVEEKITKEPTTNKSKNVSKTVKKDIEKSEKNKKSKMIISLKQLFLKKKKDIAKSTRTNSYFKDKFKKKDKVSSNKQIKQKKYQKLKSNSIFLSKKCIITIIVVCVSLIFLETAYFIYHRVHIGNKIVYYDSLNSLCIDNANIVSVGSSNFKYSKNYDYTKGLEKAKLIKYDRNGNILLEKMYENGINTTFTSVINISDGYIVVGSGEFSEQEQQDGAREAIIMKYDKEGNIVWEKYYQVVTNTRFNKVIEVEDGYIAIGQSIYANMEMGNHTTGGGIIVKYDKNGNEVWHNNHGGMKSGNFYDIITVDGDLYVVGKDATDSGNLVKFNRNGEYQWHKNYNYTDGVGFTGIAYLDQYLYVVGAKKVLPENISSNDSRDTQNTDALLVKYDKNGNIVFEKSFGGSNYERYNSILSYHNNLYVIGYISSKDAGLKISSDGKLTTGILVRYDGDGNMLKKEILGGSNNDNLTDIATDGVSLYISAYSNSKDGNITTAKNNGKDYFGKMIKLDFKFRKLLVK